MKFFIWFSCFYHTSEELHSSQRKTLYARQDCSWYKRKTIYFKPLWFHRHLYPFIYLINTRLTKNINQNNDRIIFKYVIFFHFLSYFKFFIVLEHRQKIIRIDWNFANLIFLSFCNFPTLSWYQFPKKGETVHLIKLYLT